jgi:hypothetical protein
LKKERLYLYEFLDDPVISYPAWYLLSPKLHRDERLRETLKAIHSMDFSAYIRPEKFDDLFASLSAGLYPIFREKYAIGYFGGKVMFLESGGWKAMPLSREAFELENWLI